MSVMRLVPLTTTVIRYLEPVPAMTDTRDIPVILARRDSTAQLTVVWNAAVFLRILSR